MKAMLVIADSSALIALTTCQALPLLSEIFDEVRVPRAVFDEVTVTGRPQAKLLAEFLADRVIEVDTARFVLAAGGLGQGEIEAMALYKASSADYLLIDDRRARTIAEANGIRCIGALGTLLMAKEQKRIDQVSSYVQALRESPLHYSEELLAKILQLAGE